MKKLPDNISEMTDEEMLAAVARIEKEADDLLTPVTTAIGDYVLNELQRRKDLTASRGLPVGKLVDAMDEVKVGLMTNSLVKTIIKDYNKSRAAENSQLKVVTSKMTIQQIIDDYNMHQVTVGAKMYWYYQPINVTVYGKREWVSVSREVLKAQFSALREYIRGSNGEPDYNSMDTFSELLMDQGRGFQKITQSFRSPDGVAHGNLNIIDRDFAKASVDGSTDYHWMFDAIFESISGGACSSTKEHLEQIILSKWQHPENPFLPNIFVNDNGGSGKDLFAGGLLMTLFKGSVLYNGTIEHLLGQFNNVVAGKAILHISEMARAKVNMDKLKAFLGAPTFMVEAKFETPYTADNTGLVFSTGNNRTGNLTLSGENQDRRYSIFSPQTDIYTIVARYLKKEHGKEFTHHEVDNWIKTVGQNYLKDFDQVGKWVSAMIAKHGDITHLLPVKNAAYHDMIDKQRHDWLDTVDTVFADSRFRYIRTQLLDDLLAQYSRGGVKSNKINTITDIERLIKDRGYNIKREERARIKSKLGTVIQRNVWRRVEPIALGETVQINEDESLFGHKDDNGRWIWDWVA